MLPSYAIILLSCLLSFVSNSGHLKLEKVAFWSADSKLKLEEVCQHDHMYELILDVLSVLPTETKSSHVLKMVPMSADESELLPFPHVYRFVKDKGRGAVYADYLDVSGLGSQLAECQKRNVRLLIRVKMEKALNLSRRKLILLSALLWNSFLAAAGDFYDRPFGKDVRFDGFHFVYDKSTGRQVSILMKFLKKKAENEGTGLHLGSSSADYKFSSSEVIDESDFIVTSIEPKAKTIPFVLFVPDSGKGKSTKLLQSAKLNKFFKGTLEILSKNGRLEGLKKLISRNPKESEEGSNVLIIAGLLGGSLAIASIAFLSYFYVSYRRRSAKEPIKTLE